MGLPISVEKIEETHDYLLYASGGPNTSVGCVRLYKSSGDIELATFSETDEGPDRRYYLAHVVPRLRSYHDRGAYPDTDQWTA
jgi:hypothetical protein